MGGVGKFLPVMHPVLHVEVQLGVTPGKIWGKFVYLKKVSLNITSEKCIVNHGWNC